MGEARSRATAWKVAILTAAGGSRPCATAWGAAILAAQLGQRASYPSENPQTKPPRNPRAITVRNNHTPRADHALLHLKYVTYRAKNIRFATTGWAALVAPLGEAALSSLRGMAGASAGRLAPPREATGVSPPRWRLSMRPRRSAALPCGAATGEMPSSGRG